MELFYLESKSEPRCSINIEKEIILKEISRYISKRKKLKAKLLVLPNYTSIDTQSSISIIQFSEKETKV